LGGTFSFGGKRAPVVRPSENENVPATLFLNYLLTQLDQCSHMWSMLRNYADLWRKRSKQDLGSWYRNSGIVGSVVSVSDRWLERFHSCAHMENNFQPAQLIARDARGSLSSETILLYLLVCIDARSSLINWHRLW